jgi:hypothetical protein
MEIQRGFYRTRRLWIERVGVFKLLGMEIKTFLPSLPQVSREVLAVLAATLLASWVISKVPAWQKLVRENSPPNPFN